MIDSASARVMKALSDGGVFRPGGVLGTQGSGCLRDCRVASLLAMTTLPRSCRNGHG